MTGILQRKEKMLLNSNNLIINKQIEVFIITKKEIANSIRKSLEWELDYCDVIEF